MASARVAQNVEQLPGRVAHIKAPHAPGFVGERIDDLVAQCLRTGMDRIHIVNLNGEVRHGRARTAFGRDAELHRRCFAGRQRDDLAEIHGDIEAEQLFVEIRQGRDVLSRQIADDPLDCHRVYSRTKRNVQALRDPGRDDFDFHLHAGAREPFDDQQDCRRIVALKEALADATVIVQNIHIGDVYGEPHHVAEPHV